MRRFFRGVGKVIWRFMVVFSFIVNIILLIVLLVLGLLIFDIKENIANPLISGLHSSFVGLNTATIDYTIPVRDRIPVELTVPLQTETTVVLTQNVPLAASAQINLNGSVVNTPVSLQLPAGLILPVYLDLLVPIDEELDVSLDVRAVIPLERTQLHDVAQNLRLLFEPLAFGLNNLPNSFEEAGQLVSNWISGTPPDLLAQSAYSEAPWPGFSQTAGLNYPLANEVVPEANRPVNTGIVPLGGIPLLDEQVRPDVYASGLDPVSMNEQAREAMAQQGIAECYFNGQLISCVSTAPIYTEGGEQPPAGVLPPPTAEDNYGEGDAIGGPIVPPASQNDLGIIGSN